MTSSGTRKSIGWVGGFVCAIRDPGFFFHEISSWYTSHGTKIKRSHTLQKSRRFYAEVFVLRGFGPVEFIVEFSGGILP